jgi:hypothetical protein
MQQLFNTRNYSIRDFAEWDERQELELVPKFQRRDVWNAKAKSYLMDTIIRGKPIPKLYMRQDIAPGSHRAKREIVDGQQRLRTVFSFIKDGFKLSKVHNRELGGKFFSQLDAGTQRDILKYEFVVDLLQDMPDNEIYDLFARINTYSERLKPQELRNAQWFGDFKTCVYELAKSFVGFFEKNGVFTSKQILRMTEAEFISELLLAMEEGIREGKKVIIDKAYRDYDDSFPNRLRHERRFADVIDTIGRIAGDQLPELRFRATRLFYPLFCAIYHLKYGLPRLQAPRKSVTASAYPKMLSVLEGLDELIEGIEDGTAQPSEADRKFFDAQDEHSVHVANRTFLTQHLCREFAKALK